MKLVVPPEMKHRITRWGYLAFALTMLHLVRRGRNKNIANEVRCQCQCACPWKE